MGNIWTPESWQSRKAAQQPEWGAPDAYTKVIQEITHYPPLVFSGEVQALKQLW